MKVTLFMAMSANGFIATKKGDEHFLSDENWKSFSKLVKSYNNLIVGRKTYEAVKKWDQFSFNDFKGATKVIISKRNLRLDNDYILASSPKVALEILKGNGFTKVLLAGGSELNTSFIKSGLINEVILNIDSVMIGEGIPIFSANKFEFNMKILKICKISSNIVQIHYKIKK